VRRRRPAAGAAPTACRGCDADGVLPGYTGIIVRDGYAGYEARDAAAAAGQAGQAALDAALDNLVSRYRALAAHGLTANLYRRTATAKDARRIARPELAG
jgi:hypothetical protein